MDKIQNIKKNIKKSLNNFIFIFPILYINLKKNHVFLIKPYEMNTLVMRKLYVSSYDTLIDLSIADCQGE